MTYKCIIIDDSSVHRLAISFLIKNHPQLELVGAYEDPYEGIKAIYDQHADIVFLDVLLENVNSFELLDSTEIPATIIMNSSWKEFSQKASEYNIQHFLVKPIQKENFLSTVDKALRGMKLENKQGSHTMPYLMPRPNVFQNVS